MDKVKLSSFLLDPQVARKVKALSCLVGFDGFTDDILRVVKSRQDATHFDAIASMGDFAKRIAQAQNKSANFELVLQERRLGGNAPIMADALLKKSLRVSFIGAIGFPDVESLFLPFASACQEYLTISASGHTDAVEFSDGKLLFGKHSCILSLDAPLIIERVGKENLIRLFENCHLFASCNWTMLFGMTELWQILERDIFPQAKKLPTWMFVDIADPAKRSDKDLIEAMLTLKQLQKHLKVVLGLNVAEAERVAKVMGCQANARNLRETLKIEQVVIHAIQTAEASSEVKTASVNGPHIREPRISTGGGDNFNAGYCLALLLGLDLQDALTLATHTSGYYVSQAKSPSLEELASFLL